ncbi:MAG: right-handed parallel beta-helix repeat-containing protein [Candidatus Eisenbacteria bacterium]|nr:right-handed parallel beta-helix repeat-containing protein [Candidatus Eisenbacteria bacterium]
MALIGAGSAGTVVVGDSTSPVLFVGPVASDTANVIQGITFYGGGHAGIRLNGASPIIDECTILGTVDGPGILCESHAAPVIRRCYVASNDSSGIWMSNTLPGTVHVNDTTIKWNTASTGAGIRCEPNTSIHVDGGEISSNIATQGGGGIYCADTTSVQIQGTSLSWNTTVGDGGGLYLASGSSASILGCLVSHNYADGHGGGIFCDIVAPETMTVSGCEITENRAINGAGAWFGKGSAAAVTDNELTSNVSSGNGSAIYCDTFSAQTVTGNVISGNHAAESGTVYLTIYSTSVLTDNTVFGNSVDGNGGGFFVHTGYMVELRANTIFRNEAGGFGGGIALYWYCAAGSGRTTITGNVIADNRAESHGGGLYCFDARDPRLLKNTFTRNTAGSGGGGIWFSHYSNCNFRSRSNSFTDNTADHLGDAVYIDSLSDAADSIAVFGCSNFAHNNCALYNNEPDIAPNARFSWWGCSDGPPGAGCDSVAGYTSSITPVRTEADTTAPPMPPRNLSGYEVGTPICTLHLSWDPVPLSDLAGYKVYYDLEGWPYASSVDVGNVTEYYLEGLQPHAHYHAAVTCYDDQGNESWFSSEADTNGIPCGVPGSNETVPAVMLLPSAPNPFSVRTRIQFDLPFPASVSCSILDVTGRAVRTFAATDLQAGRNAFAWNGQDDRGRRVASGIYFYRLTTNGHVHTGRVALLR